MYNSKYHTLRGFVARKDHIPKLESFNWKVKNITLGNGLNRSRFKENISNHHGQYVVFLKMTITNKRTVQICKSIV